MQNYRVGDRICLFGMYANFHSRNDWDRLFLHQGFRVVHIQHGMGASHRTDAGDLLFFRQSIGRSTLQGMLLSLDTPEVR